MRTNDSVRATSRCKYLATAWAMWSLSQSVSAPFSADTRKLLRSPPPRLCARLGKRACGSDCRRRPSVWDSWPSTAQQARWSMWWTMTQANSTFWKVRELSILPSASPRSSQHAPASGARHHRNGGRGGPGGLAAGAAGGIKPWPPACIGTGSVSAHNQWPRHRDPHLCRGPGAQLPALHWFAVVLCMRSLLPTHPTGLFAHVAFNDPSARVDTWIATGVEVSAFFDSLLAKIMVHGNTRADAISRMTHALHTTEVRMLYDRNLKRTHQHRSRASSPTCSISSKSSQTIALQLAAPPQASCSKWPTARWPSRCCSPA